MQEYLSGLVEESGIKNTFAQWVEHLPGASQPPAVRELVEPDPGKLQTAAYNELAHEALQLDTTGCPGCTPLSPPGGDDDFVPPDDGE